MIRNRRRLGSLIVVALQICAPLIVAAEDPPDPNAAARASEALKTARNLEFLSVKEVTNLLLDDRFEEFETRSKRYEHQFEIDPLWESSLCKLYEAIGSNNPDLKEKLDKWVRLRPSYMAYTARGAYEVSLAYVQRGDRYVPETPPENLAKMDATMAEAQTDLRRALNANPKFVPAYIALLEVAQAIGGVEAAALVERRATREVPTTYYVRDTYLLNLRPRWGGSYELMTAYEQSLTSAARLNPRIWSLKGRSWAERGYTAMLEGNAPAAIVYYTKALDYGDRMEFLKARGDAYFNLGQYDLALKDYARYREYNATDDDVDATVRCIDQLRSGRLCDTSVGNWASSSH